MRLIKCYAENFGVLHHASIEFHKGINCCLDENGKGKTTLSAFIEAMLYGIGDTRKLSLDENARRKYNPWQGGRYGGSLTVEIGKRTYTIERSFGQKAADDTFRLIDSSGRESTDYSENIGEELFGIDRDGFLRTVFLSEKNLSGKNENKSIAAKLSDLVGTPGDVGGLDEAVKLLDKKRQFYHKKNNTGEIANVTERIKSTRAELDNLTRLAASASEAKARHAELKRELEELREGERAEAEKLGKLSRERAHMSYEETYARMCVTLENGRRSLAEAEAFFGGKVPTLADIDEAERAAEESKRLSREVAADGAGEEYVALRRFFGGGTSFLELSEITEAESRLREKETALLHINTGLAPAAVERSGLFKGEIPTDEELSAAEKAASSGGFGKRRATGLALAIIGAVLLAVGLIKTLLPLTVSGAPVLVLGLVLLILPKKKGEAAAFIKKYGGDDFAPIGEALRDIRSDLERYKELTRELDTDKALLEEEIASLKLRIYEFLGKFPKVEASSIKDAIDHIRSEYSKFYSLEQFAEKAEGGRLEKLKSAEALALRAKEFTSRCKTETDNPFSEIRERVIKYNYERVTIEKHLHECERYAEEHGVTGKITAHATLDEDMITKNLSSIKARLDEANREYVLLDRELSSASAELERRDELEAKLAELTELLQGYKEKLEIIKKTQSLLKEACDSITEKYLEKTSSGFKKYSEAISGETGEYTLSTDFEYAKTERGITHGEESYSRGLRDLYGMSMRFALVDALYDKELPFIILDDPFIALDDKNLARAKFALKQMAKDRQIIYFTCAEARRID